MKIIDKMSYALWVYDNTSSTTIGFYKVVGSDLKELLPNVMTFNKQMAGNVEVQNPMAWGQARKHTWNEIVANGFNKDPDAFEHCGPDGSNMSDDDVSDYWNYVGGANGAEESSKQSKEDFLAHLDELSTTPASKFSNAVYELAEFILSMHPEAEKNDVWIGPNFVRGANVVVRVLQAMPDVIINHFAGMATFAMNNGPDVEGMAVAGGSRHALVVALGGDVWSIESTPRGPLGKRLSLTAQNPNIPSEGTIDPPFNVWFAMPTAAEVLRTIASADGLIRHLSETAREMLAKALAAMRGQSALEPAVAAN